jgi:Ca2+:H+ antiporter
VAAILPVSYLVGLLFTLKTHAHIFSNAAAGEGEGGDDGHDAPRWSKLKAVIILAVSIVLFSLVAEELVKAIEPTLEALNIGQTFAGVTVLALVPSSAEVHPVSCVCRVCSCVCCRVSWCCVCRVVSNS